MPITSCSPPSAAAQWCVGERRREELGDVGRARPVAGATSVRERRFAGRKSTAARRRG